MAMLKGRWRRIAFMAAVLVLLASIAAVWVWQQRRPLAEQAIARALAEQGIAPVSFAVSFIGLRSISLSDVVIGDPAAPDAHADGVTITYSIGELLSGRVRSIEVDRAGGRVGISRKGVSLGVLDPLLEGGGGGRFRIPPADIESLSIDIVTPEGNLAIDGSVSISSDEDAILVSAPGILIRDRDDAPRIAPLLAEGTMRVAPDAISARAFISSADISGGGVPLLHAEGEYDVESGAGVIRGEGSLALDRDGGTISRLLPVLASYYIDLTGSVSYGGEASFKGGNVSIAAHAEMVDLALRQTAAGDARVSGRIDFAASFGGAAQPFRADLSRVRIEDMSRPERFAPVTLEGPVRMGNRQIEGNLVLRSAVPSIRGARLANVDAMIDLEKGEGSLRANGDLTLAPGQIELQTMFPMLKGAIARSSGGLSYNAMARLSRSGLSTSGNIVLNDAAIVASGATIGGVSGLIRLSSIVPLATNGVQTLTVREIEAGVPLQEGKILFEIGRGGVRLVDAVWPFADGSLSVASSSTSVLAEEAAFLVTVDNADLRMLLEIADVPGLRATGHVSGTIPVIIRDGEIILVDGALAALDEGIIVYRSEASDAARTEQTKLLTDALKNFHYTELRGELSGNATGEVMLRLSLRGANPDLYEGYPFAINVNVEGSLADLFRHGTVGFRPLELIKQKPDAPAP